MEVTVRWDSLAISEWIVRRQKNDLLPSQNCAVSPLTCGGLKTLSDLLLGHSLMVDQEEYQSYAGDGFFYFWG